jgi:hypothetical protein
VPRIAGNLHCRKFAQVFSVQRIAAGHRHGTLCGTKSAKRQPALAPAGEDTMTRSAQSIDLGDDEPAMITTSSCTRWTVEEMSEWVAQQWRILESEGILIHRREPGAAGLREAPQPDAGEHLCE